MVLIIQRLISRRCSISLTFARREARFSSSLFTIALNSGSLLRLLNPGNVIRGKGLSLHPYFSSNFIKPIALLLSPSTAYPAAALMAVSLAQKLFPALIYSPPLQLCSLLLNDLQIFFRFHLYKQDLYR